MIEEIDETLYLSDGTVTLGVDKEIATVIVCYDRVKVFIILTPEQMDALKNFLTK